MKIKKSFCLRSAFIGLYVFSFLVFLVIGFMPAEANAHDDDYGELVIPSIDFASEVVTAEKDEGELKVPYDMVGRYSRYKNKTLLVGHSSTVFGDLVNVRIGDKIAYDDNIYAVSNVELVEKDLIEMRKILKAEVVDTLIIMTCAGQDLGGGDSTHRLLVTAIEV